ncbi:RHS repeat domain-containing protein [Aequorivita viscosa]|nr:RHS repeat-associated core domain-containing protein [Aequorivita viscosa]
MKYLPFGETLVEEHLNSNNSPYKFNAKELDAETGNYYYGARYYDPKWSIWLSIDPLAEQMLEWSSYNYAFSNPNQIPNPK